MKTWTYGAIAVAVAGAALATTAYLRCPTCGEKSAVWTDQPGMTADENAAMGFLVALGDDPATWTPAQWDRLHNLAACDCPESRTKTVAMYAAADALAAGAGVAQRDRFLQVGLDALGSPNDFYRAAGLMLAAKAGRRDLAERFVHDPNEYLRLTAEAVMRQP